MDAVIRTENLSKHYGKLKAVDNVSINVRKGEIYGFLGLNGAGKTTTIRMLLGLIRPTSGISYLNGIKVNPGNPAMWGKIGYMVEVPYSYPDLTVKENLEIISNLRLLVNTKSVGNIIEKLKLDQYKDVIAKNLSLGNAQRLGIAKALIHEPDVLILDEPANGLDPVGIVEIRELLIDLAVNKGVTVFVSSHILGEISRFATRIGIIHEGKLIHESSLAEMESMRKKALRIKTSDMEGTEKILKYNGLEPSVSDDGYFELIQNTSIANPEKVATLLVHAGFPPTMLKVEEEDLESFFIRMISMKGGAR